MNIRLMKPVLTAAALAALAGTAFAQAPATATATTDLNVRAGPGPQYPVVGVIGANQEAALDGCMEGSKWCRVTIDGAQGWAYSDYLTATLGQQQQVVVTERAPEAVPVVTYDQTAIDTGPVAGELVGRIGSDGVINEIAPPPEPVRTYVGANRVDPVYLDGEVVVGAGIPEAVPVREIPDYQYSYTYVNGQPVLVDPGSRRIVYVVRD